MKRTLHRITLSSGVCLEYAERGDDDGVPMLLLHGITDSWRSFEPVLEELASGVLCFALSQRGHGDSDRPAHGYRTRDFAADAAAFIDAMGLGPMLVVGHSMGSVNAMRLAIDHPELVSGLVLAGAFAGFRHNAALVDFHREAIVPLQDPIAAQFVRDFQLSTLAQSVPEPFLDQVVAESLKVPAAVWRDAFAALFDDDFFAEVGRIRVPTQIHWGDADAFCPRADQDALLRAIASSRLITYAGAGHAFHWERPAGFAANLMSFVHALGEANHAVQAA